MADVRLQLAALTIDLFEYILYQLRVVFHELDIAFLCCIFFLVESSLRLGVIVLIIASACSIVCSVLIRRDIERILQG